MVDALEKVKKELQSPPLVAQRLNQVIYSRGGFRPYNVDGVDIFDEDWDYLLILDACRYDMFEQLVEQDSRLAKQVSRGSSTEEWLYGNIGGRDLLDTVYVTANPQYVRLRDDLNARFHAVYNLWETQWDEDIETVPPDAVVSAAKSAAEDYPEKRILIHFMQPHLKFLGPSADQLPEPQKALWYKKMRGEADVDDELLWTCYTENLELVLDKAIALSEALEGKSVISSDHGNLTGERVFPAFMQHYGHPKCLYHPKLVEVPWMVFQSDNRRHILAEEPDSHDKRHDSELVEGRLEELGYI